ncbi:unnamed protein product [Symbiodinium sp. CCMP2456]|nr:unnamed protein product [Symbiodinium sp. CCMP2456]
MPPIWEVVGGADKGGILVRQGKELTSEPESSRLSTGALILEKEMHGERMRYFRLSGTGPEVGWVSLKVKDKAMVKRREEKRKPRVLALHGAPSNSNIMKFQTGQLRKLAGEDFEWLFVDGPCAWKPLPGSKLMNLAERTPVEKAIAKDKPFVQWYSHPELSPEETAAGKGYELDVDFDNVQYENVDEGVRFLDEFLKSTSACSYRLVLRETLFAMCVSVQFMNAGVAVLSTLEILISAATPILGAACQPFFRSWLK